MLFLPIQSKCSFQTNSRFAFLDKTNHRLLHFSFHEINLQKRTFTFGFRKQSTELHLLQLFFDPGIVFVSCLNALIIVQASFLKWISFWIPIFHFIGWLCFSSSLMRAFMFSHNKPKAWLNSWLCQGTLKALHRSSSFIITYCSRNLCILNIILAKLY